MYISRQRQGRTDSSGGAKICSVSPVNASQDFTGRVICRTIPAGGDLVAAWFRVQGFRVEG